MLRRNFFLLTICVSLQAVCEEVSLIPLKSARCSSSSAFYLEDNHETDNG